MIGGDQIQGSSAPHTEYHHGVYYEQTESDHTKVGSEQQSKEPEPRDQVKSNDNLPVYR